MSPKYLHHIVLVGICVVVVYIAVGLFFLLRPPNANQAGRIFQANQEDMQIVVAYMMKTENRNFYIGANADNIIPLDRDVIDAINRLFQQGFRSIEKNEEGVRFLRWIHRIEQGHGIVYLPNGRLHDGTGLIPFLTELEPLSETGWYYYVDFFSEWRRRQRNS